MTVKAEQEAPAAGAGISIDALGALARAVVAAAGQPTLAEALESPAALLVRPALELAGEALAAALDEAEPAAEVTRVAASVVGASAGLLWQRGGDGRLELAGSHGLDADAPLDEARRLATEALDDGG